MDIASTADSAQIEQLVDNEPGRGHRALGSPASAPARPLVGWWTKAHWALLLIALIVLVIAGHGQHFFYDEWAFVGGKLDALPLPDRYLVPHNEHWTLLPLVAYRTLRATVGLGSYWPYLGLLLSMHLGVTHILWRLMLVTGSKPVVATALAAVFSVLGAAAEDLVWAFQIAFVGSTLFGVTAVYLALTGAVSWRKIAALACLTMASLATSGVGLAYLIVVPLVLARRGRRFAVVVFCLPLMVYVTWYAMYGRSLTHPPNVSAAVPLMVGAFAAIGLTSALTKLFGLEMDGALPVILVGMPILTGIALACRRWVTDRELAGRPISTMCLGAVAFFGTAGLARGGLGLGIATSGRYVYVAIALLLPAIARIISRGTDRRPRLKATVVPLAILMALSNVFQLMAFATETRHNSDRSLRSLVAASDLVRTRSAIFTAQLPEPLLAPDLTTADLKSGRLDAAFEGVNPHPLDRLTASLNLQIRVAPAPATGAASTCDTTFAQRIIVPTSRGTSPRFRVSAGSPIRFTMHDPGSQSAQRVIDLVKGTYVITSLRDAEDLTIESNSPSSRVARC